MFISDRIGSGQKFRILTNPVPVPDPQHCFLLQVFFHESPSPKLLIITLGSSRIFSKIRGDIRKSNCTTGVNDTGGKLPLVSTTPAANLPPVSTTPAANFATSSPCLVDTGGKFAAGVNDAGGKQ
jgi:hypothetical protein